MLYCKEGIWHTQSTQSILLYHPPLGNLETSNVTEALGGQSPFPGAPPCSSSQHRTDHMTLLLFALPFSHLLIVFLKRVVPLG